MGSLNKFLGKPKEIEIDGEKIIIHPLKVKDMHLFSNQNASDEQKAKMSTDILRLSIPDADEEEINNLPVEVFVKLMEEINKLNGFTNEDIDSLRLAKKRMQGASQ